MFLISYLFLGVICFFVFIFTIYSVYAMFKGAPFVPTNNKSVQKMLELSNLKLGEKMIDLGSGDGRIVFAAAKTGAVCLGLEINPVLCYWSKFKCFLKRSKNVKFKRINFWNYHLGEINVMFIYFIPGKMEQLQQKIMQEMKPGSRIISYSFTFPNWQYQAKDGKIYLYKV